MDQHKIKYILENIDTKSPAEIARHLGLKERKVRRFIESVAVGKGHSQEKTMPGLASLVSSPDGSKDRYLKLLAIILIGGLGTVVYSNSLHCAFHFDDVYTIINNSFIRDFSNLRAIWDFLPRRFFLYLSIALNYRFSGLDVVGYHIFNVSIHLISAMLVWWLTRLTLVTPVMRDDHVNGAGTGITRHADLVALFVGLVFVLHPVQTQAVTYIVQRAAVMATLFYVASLCLYVKARLLKDGGSSLKLWGSCYAGSILAAIVAMFTKEISITLPLSILLYELSFFRMKSGLKWKFLAPFLGMMLIIPVTMKLTESAEVQLARGVMSDGPSGISSMHYLLTQFKVVVTYIKLLFLPLNQNLDHDIAVSNSIQEPSTLISFLLLLSILVTAQRLYARYRLVSFSIFLFFLTLLPESSFFPIRDVMFEHRLYLPMVAYSLFLVSGLYYLWGRNVIRAMFIVLTVILASYGALTYERNKVWKSELTLWDDAISKSPDKPRTHNNRGAALLDAGKLIEAIADYSKAIELDPDYADAYYNRGNAYRQQGNLSKAIADYSKAIELKPDCFDAYNNRGAVFEKRGEFVQALSDYDHAIALVPYYAKAYCNRGEIYAKQGNAAQALAEYNRALGLDPYLSEAYNDRAGIYYGQSKFTEALSDYNKAIAINPKVPSYFSNRALADYMLKQYDQAWADIHRAEGFNITVDPKLTELLKKASGREK
ncbi:MAG: tetratricopeptide repeat protein [Candidatus Omnitrophica bacterium]|nr:tetratricopeptide repeat protein [Candidatus Omnitrophota bacterium]